MSPKKIQAPASVEPDSPARAGYALRAAAHKPHIQALLQKLYFSEEDADFSVSNESGKFAARLKQFREALEAEDDPSILATVMMVVAENSSAVRSIKRLQGEFQNVVRGSSQLSKAANLKDFATFVVPYITGSDSASMVRTFAATVLVPHTFVFNGRRPEDIPASALNLDAGQLTAITDVLKGTFSTEQKALSQQLMMLTGPYMGVSDVVRQSYISLLANPPQDRDLRFGLILTLKGQKWPVYEIQAVFDFMMDAVDPRNPSLLSAVTEAFDTTPLMKGDDPRSKTYLERLSSAYSYLNAQAPSDTPDKRESIVWTVIAMDVPGAPAILKDYLMKPEVSVDVKEELLRRVTNRAIGDKNNQGFYSKTRQELISTIRDVQATLGQSHTLQEATDECLKALSR